MSDVTIELARDGDLAEILRTFGRFWGDQDFPRPLHHPMFFCEFGDTAFVARRDGEIAGTSSASWPPQVTVTSTSWPSAMTPGPSG